LELNDGVGEEKAQEEKEDRKSKKDESGGKTREVNNSDASTDEDASADEEGRSEQRQKPENNPKELYKISREVKLATKIIDILDELKIITSVINDQKGVIDEVEKLVILHA